jgi:hypothetical protein
MVAVLLIVFWIGGMAVGGWIVHSEERAMVRAELDTGEIEIDGRRYRVQSIEFPDRVEGRLNERWVMAREQEHERQIQRN